MQDDYDYEPIPTPVQYEGKWNGCKHVRSLHVFKPAGHRAKRKRIRKLQRAARKAK